MYDLERNGGSIFGGVIKLLQERRKNPPPPRDSRLPPKPKGQTVGSFRKGLQSLPEAMAVKMKDNIRSGPAACLICAVGGQTQRIQHLSVPASFISP